jgi:hypothetical protein
MRFLQGNGYPYVLETSGLLHPHTLSAGIIPVFFFQIHPSTWWHTQLRLSKKAIHAGGQRESHVGT